MMKFIPFLIVLIVPAACSINPNNTTGSYGLKNTDTIGGDNIEFAKGFTISDYKENKYLVVKNPWKADDTLATYLLLKNDSKNDFTGRIDFVIKSEPDRIAVLSSASLGMIELLHEENRIVACSNAKLIYDSALYRRYLKGELTDLGESLEMNTETVIGASPDLVIKYIFGGREAADEKLIEAGIPVVYNLEFMEPHPLGRAEWLKFVAVFVGKEAMADSVFRHIRDEYQILSERARKVPKRPTVLDGSSYKGVWYAAGGRSYPARLYADAGASYFWASDSNRGSIPLSFEIILNKQADADYWIGPSTGNKHELLGIESRYALLKSFRTDNVFDFGKRMNPNGGLDYFERGVVRPDILLKDLLWVFHRELLDSAYQPVYIERIKD
jgi:iron complex transport system substrate-binding protein